MFQVLQKNEVTGMYRSLRRDSPALRELGQSATRCSGNPVGVVGRDLITFLALARSEKEILSLVNTRTSKPRSSCGGGSRFVVAWRFLSTMVDRGQGTQSNGFVSFLCPAALPEYIQHMIQRQRPRTTTTIRGYFFRWLFMRSSGGGMCSADGTRTSTVLLSA